MLRNGVIAGRRGDSCRGADGRGPPYTRDLRFQIYFRRSVEIWIQICHVSVVILQEESVHGADALDLDGAPALPGKVRHQPRQVGRDVDAACACGGGGWSNNGATIASGGSEGVLSLLAERTAVIGPVSPPGPLVKMEACPTSCTFKGKSTSSDRVVPCPP